MLTATIGSVISLTDCPPNENLMTYVILQKTVQQTTVYRLLSFVDQLLLGIGKGRLCWVGLGPQGAEGQMAAACALNLTKLKCPLAMSV